MNDLLDTILAAMPDGAEERARRCACALREQLGHPAPADRRTVLVGYGGGKDSTYMVAFVRVVQLLYRREFGATFTVRAITNRQPGMTPAVLENIRRVYDTLAMTGDPSCELLLREGSVVRPFQAGLPADPAMVRRYRDDMLMAGHRSAGSGRPTFCNSCNFDMVASFADGARFGGDVDLVITGDSTREQRLYQIWVRRLAERVLPDRAKAAGYRGLQDTVAELAAQYFKDLHGPARSAPSSTGMDTTARAATRFFSIYDYTGYSAKGHWSFLTDFLGFQFDELAFNFTESDCANPLLMAHLRGLRVERTGAGDYADGIDSYVRFAVDLMASKEISAHLIAEMCDRYAGPERVARMRDNAVQYSESTYGVNDEQLVCMVFSPFVDRCRGLERYLRAEQPSLLERAGDIRALLLGERDDDELAAEIERMSGLSLDQARQLVRAPASSAVDQLSGGDVLTEILRRDPYKIYTGSEYISGR